MIDRLLDRLTWRIRLYRLPGACGLRDRATIRRRRLFDAAQPRMSDRSRSLTEQGIVIADCTALASLFGSDGAAALAARIDAFAAHGWGEKTDLIETDAIARGHPDLYRAGLAAPLLDLVEAYFGEPCRFLACSMKVERPDGGRGDVRQWHTDIEDDRMVRVLVYLSDVGAGDGPFAYLPLPATERLRAALGYRNGYVADDRVAAVLPADEWRDCRGEAGCVVLFDGTRIMHRASPPTAATRCSISFTYTTRHPLHVFHRTRLSRAQHRTLATALDGRARAALPVPHRIG